MLRPSQRSLAVSLTAVATLAIGCQDNTFSGEMEVLPTPQQQPRRSWQNAGSDEKREAVSPYPSLRTCLEALPETGDRQVDRVIPAGCEVRVPVGYHIDSGSLTLEAGSKLVFAKGAALTVGFTSSARLLVRGSADNPVQMQSIDGASYEGIRLMKHADGSAISYLELTGAGTRQHGAIHCEAEGVAIDHTKIIRPASVALHVSGGGNLEVFSANTIESETVAPGRPIVLLPPVALHAFDSSNRFPAQSVVHVLPGMVRTSGTWPRVSVPLVIGGVIEIAGTKKQLARVEIAGGNELRFQAEANINVGYFDPGALILSGSEQHPIVMTAADEKRPGAWKGIKLYKHATGTFHHTRFEYGGAELDRGVVYATSQAVLTVEDCQFHHNKVGLVLFRDGVDIRAIRRNHFVNTPRIARLSPTTLGAFHGSNRIDPLPDQSLPRILTETGAISRDVRWAALGATIELRGPISVDDATLTIGSGTTFEVADGFALDIGERATASLQMKGTEQQPIRISGSKPDRSTWDAIVLHGHADDVEVEWVDLIGAGGESAIEVKDGASAALDHVSCTRCYSPVLTWQCGAEVESGELRALAGTPGTRAPPSDCG